MDGTATLVRRLCTELRPGVLDDLGLTAAIEWQAREYQSRTGITCAVKITLWLTVDPSRSTALFRIFQEILTNVAPARAGHTGGRSVEGNGRADLAAGV